MSKPQGCIGALLGFGGPTRRRKKPPFTATLICGHCSTANMVAGCQHCGRSYVLTDANLEGRMRDAEAKPVGNQRVIFTSFTCDACLAKYYGNEAEAERQQRTCPACHKEFLSQHGL